MPLALGTSMFLEKHFKKDFIKSVSSAKQTWDQALAPEDPDVTTAKSLELAAVVDVLNGLDRHRIGPNRRVSTVPRMQTRCDILALFAALRAAYRREKGR